MTAGLATVSMRALGTTAFLAIDDGCHLDCGRTLLEEELDRVDLACSRFREDSELAFVNRCAGRTVQVGPVLGEAILVALLAAQESNGRVDPTVGPCMRALGYDRDYAQLAGVTPPGRPHPTPGAGAVEYDPRSRRVSLAPGAELDLGATAKALAADRAAREIAAMTGARVLVNLGGDIAVAGEPPRAGWAVRVTDDHGSNVAAPGQTVRVDAGGLATSSTTVRAWGGPDHPVHHIVDPATGWSACVVWRTVSVAAATCVGANTASTAAIVLGEVAPRWLAQLQLPARLVRPDGEVVTVGGWPEDARS